MIEWESRRVANWVLVYIVYKILYKLYYTMSTNNLVADWDEYVEWNFDDLILWNSHFTLHDVLRILETRDEVLKVAYNDEGVRQIIQLEVVSALQEIVWWEGLIQEDRDKLNYEGVFEKAKVDAETQIKMEQEFASLAWNKYNDPWKYTESYKRVIKELYSRIPEASFVSPLSGNSWFLIQHIKDKEDRWFNHLSVSWEEIVFDDITKDFYMMRNGRILRIDLNYIYYPTFWKNHPFARWN